MDDGQGAPNTESGREFREKFEATLAEVNELKSVLAEKLGVSADDLKGVPANQLVTKATEIQEARKAERARVLKESLEERGFSGEQLEAALAQLGQSGQSAQATATPAPTPFTSTGSLGGTPPAAVNTDNVRGADRIRDALENLSKNQK